MKVTREYPFVGAVFSVAVDRWTLEDGSTSRVDSVVASDCVCMVPIIDGAIEFVRQGRMAIGESDFLELPAGRIEEGETPEQAAIRELREEIGMAPARVESLGYVYTSPGISTEKIHVFVCSVLRDDPLPQDEGEAVSTERVGIAQVQNMILDGTLTDAKSIVALSLFLLKYLYRRPIM